MAALIRERPWVDDDGSVKVEDAIGLMDMAAEEQGEAQATGSLGDGTAANRGAIGQAVGAGIVGRRVRDQDVQGVR